MSASSILNWKKAAIRTNELFKYAHTYQWKFCFDTSKHSKRNNSLSELTIIRLWRKMSNTMKMKPEFHLMWTWCVSWVELWIAMLFVDNFKVDWLWERKGKWKLFLSWQTKNRYSYKNRNVWLPHPPPSHANVNNLQNCEFYFIFMD